MSSPSLLQLPTSCSHHRCTLCNDIDDPQALPLCYDCLTSLPYQYGDLGERQIRLLELDPGAENNSIRCRLFVVPLDENPVYEALSYVWGDPTDPLKIECSNRSLYITINLWSALHALRYLYDKRIIWADAICINQSDEKEKGNQVQMMGEIYKKASTVRVWLGHISDDTHRLDARVAIAAIKDFRKEGFEKEADPELALTNEQQTRWEALRRFFDRPWFKRVWVVQEAGFAQEAIFHCGKLTFTWEELSDFVSWLFSPRTIVSRYFSIDRRQYNLIERFRSQRLDFTNNVGPESKRYGFLDLLDDARGLQCTNAMDAIYAFLGHPASYESDLGDTEFQPRTPITKPIEQRTCIVTPDYDHKSLGELYYELALEALRRNLSIPRLLSFVANDFESLDDIDSGFPSWVPIWSVHSVPRHFSKKHHYTASGILPPTKYEIINQVNLKITAMFVDRVQLVWPFPGPECFTILNNIFIRRRNTIADYELNPIEDTWQDFSDIQAFLPLSSTTALNEEPALSLALSFSAAITAGLKNGEPSITTNEENRYADFCAYRLEKSEVFGPDLSDATRLKLEGSAPHGNAEQYLADVQSACANRTFFYTDKGYIGLGPRIMREEDECWLPMGSNVPFILKSLEGEYQVLGQAYVHDMMYGEALGLGNEFQDILLC